MSQKNTFLNGAWAGVMATAAMSLLMWAGQKSGGVGKLPPRKITEAGLAATGAEDTHVITTKAISTVAHFGFGGAAGSLYAIGAQKARVTGILPGVAYGLLVWFVNYKGWIPKLGILPYPEDDRKARARTMFLAHIVYGACLGRWTGVKRSRRVFTSNKLQTLQQRPIYSGH